MIETAIYDRLIADTDIASMVGNRIYPLILPQNPTFPAITYQKEGVTRPGNFDAAADTYAVSYFQIDAWGLTFEIAKDLHDKIKICLNNFVGLMGTDRIYRLAIESETPAYEIKIDAYRVSGMFVINHKE